MRNGNGNFSLRPEWVSLAEAHDAFGMANAMYTDLKHHYYNGMFIPPEAIEKLMEAVVSVLYSDHQWSEDDIGVLESKFSEFNQYYPKEVEGADIPEVIKAILPHLMKNGDCVFPSSDSAMPGAMMPSVGTSHVHMEFVRHKSKKQRRWDKTKTIVSTIFKTAVYWLALLGLLTLIGL